MADSVSPSVEPKWRWYRGVSRYAWLILVVAALGWMFDAMDQNLFNIVRQPSVTELLQRSGMTGRTLDDAARAVGTQITSLFLVGWAVGGLVFGVIGDRLGRARTMTLTILIYAAFTGLNAWVQSPMQYATCRFLAALGVGGEFAAGASLVAEVWPDRSRPMALGLLQCFAPVGNIVASLVVISLSAQNWRWVFLVGAGPALLVVGIRASVKEPERWRKTREDAVRRGATAELGNLRNLLGDRRLRRNTLAGMLMTAAGVGGLWGVAVFLPDLTGTVLKPMVSHLPKSVADARLAGWRSQVFMMQQVGAIPGMISSAMLSMRFGRKPTLLLFLILAWAAVVGAVWGVRDIATADIWSIILGFCALAPFASYALYLPELYPTRLRATGVGLCYNGARLLVVVAPLALGNLAARFGSATDPALGFRRAASLVACVYLVGFLGLLLAPETRGRPLPE